MTNPPTSGAATRFELLVYPALYAARQWRFVMKRGTVDLAPVAAQRV